MSRGDGLIVDTMKTSIVKSFDCVTNYADDGGMH